MANSIYRVTEIVGTSTRSWEDAVKSAVQTAAKSLRDLRVAEVGALDVTIGEDGKLKSYRAKVKLSFKFEPEGAVRAAAEPAAAPAPKVAAAKAASKKKTSKKKVSKKKSRRRS
jgi:flavin-binding protein dodecin